MSCCKVTKDQTLLPRLRRKELFHSALSPRALIVFSQIFYKAVDALIISSTPSPPLEQKTRTTNTSLSPPPPPFNSPSISRTISHKLPASPISTVNPSPAC